MGRAEGGVNTAMIADEVTIIVFQGLTFLEKQILWKELYE